MEDVESIAQSMPVSDVPVSPRKYEDMTLEERAACIAKAYLVNGKNNPVLIFDEDDLRALKRYEYAVRRLPSPVEVENNRAFALLGWQTADINVFFDNLRKHVGEWDVIEDMCKDIAGDLQVFSQVMLVEGDAIIKVLRDIGSWDADITLEALQALPMAVEDVEKLREVLDDHLTAIERNITTRRNDISAIRTRVDLFGKAVVQNLQPMADSFAARLGETSVAEKLAAIELELVELDRQIAARLKEYNGLVARAFTGAVLGPIGLIFTGGIYGAQAESIRAIKNQLIEQRARLASDKDALLGSEVGFEDIRTKILDIQFRLRYVEEGARHLEEVWSTLGAYARQSMNEIGFTSTQADLRRFTLNFQRVIWPWANIWDYSKQISRLFDNVIRDMEKEQ